MFVGVTNIELLTEFAFALKARALGEESRRDSIFAIHDAYIKNV